MITTEKEKEITGRKINNTYYSIGYSIRYHFYFRCCLYE